MKTCQTQPWFHPHILRSHSPPVPPVKASSTIGGVGWSGRKTFLNTCPVQLLQASVALRAIYPPYAATRDSKQTLNHSSVNAGPKHNLLHKYLLLFACHSIIGFLNIYPACHGMQTPASPLVAVRTRVYARRALFLAHDVKSPSVFIDQRRFLPTWVFEQTT